MKKLNEKIDLIVKNDTESLRQALGLENVKSKGNHIYTGQMGEHLTLIIKTEAVDREGKEIRIKEIKIDISVFKIEVVYETTKGDQMFQTILDLPIARHRYDEVEEAFDTKNGMYDEFKALLEKLAILQGFDKLDKFTVHF